MNLTALRSAIARGDQHSELLALVDALALHQRCAATLTVTADERAHLAEQIERRAAGFAARGDIIFNGSIIAEELRHWRDEVAALSALDCAKENARLRKAVEQIADVGNHGYRTNFSEAGHAECHNIARNTLNDGTVPSPQVAEQRQEESND